MMPMPKGATAWEMEPQRKMGAVFINTFGSGAMVGVAMGAAHEHRREAVRLAAGDRRIVGIFRMGSLAQDTVVGGFLPEGRT
jgi:hypothetical protein